MKNDIITEITCHQNYFCGEKRMTRRGSESSKKKNEGSCEKKLRIKN